MQASQRCHVQNVHFGPGRVVLGTFHHSAGDVCDVRQSDGTQLGVTARHPVWSVDRGEWVPVGGVAQTLL